VREDSREAKARMLSKLPLVTRLRLSLSFSYTCRHSGTNSFIFINIVGSQSRSFIINNIVGSTFISRFFGVVFPRLLLCLEACSRSVRPAPVEHHWSPAFRCRNGTFHELYAFSQSTNPRSNCRLVGRPEAACSRLWPRFGGYRQTYHGFKYMSTGILSL
jgi:hypothetical protein